MRLEEKPLNQCGMKKDDWQALPEILKFVNRQGLEDWYGKGAIRQFKKIEKKLNKIADSFDHPPK